MDKVTEALLDKVPPELLTNRSRFWKGFIYGEYGVGKTVVTGSCIQKRGLIIATDRGSDVFYNHPEILDKVEIVPYQGLAHLTAIATAVEEGHPRYSEFDLIACDTISQIQEEYLDWLNDNYTFAGDLRTRATPRPEAKRANMSLKEQEIIGFGDYHLARRYMSTPIKSLIKAPVNVMFLAHLREPSFLEVGKGKLVRRPTLTETVFKLIAREVSFLGLMERSGTKRTIQFSTDKRTVSKSQIAELDDKTINADQLSEILQTWKEK
jgi:hypothetical protein